LPAASVHSTIPPGQEMRYEGSPLEENVFSTTGEKHPDRKITKLTVKKLFFI